MATSAEQESLWSAFNMLVKILLFALLSSMGEIALSAANPIKDTCHQPFRETAASYHTGPVKLCCKPIENSGCAPGHEVVPCQRNYGPDQCRPCDRGLIQNQYSDSKNIYPCHRPTTCAEEAELVEVGATWQCQCNSSRGYCGEAQDCLWVDKVCPDGFKLHHRYCNCTPVRLETPTALSKSATTPAPGLTTELLNTTGSPRNGSSVKENATTTTSPLARTDGSESSTDSHSADKGKHVPNSTRTEGSAAASPPLSAEEKEVLSSDSDTRGNADTNSTVIIIGVIFAVLVFCLLVGFGIFWRRGNNNNSHNTSVTTLCCSVWHPLHESEDPGQPNEENYSPLVSAAASHSSMSEENPETVVAVEEERMAVPEGDSSEEGPDETSRKDSYIAINNRASADMFIG